jgi:hypothetical protein
MLHTYVDLRQLGRSPGDRDDGDGIRTKRNVCNLRQQRPAIVTLTSSNTARRQPSTAGNVASDPRRQLAAEERIATEAGTGHNCRVAAHQSIGQQRLPFCETRNTHSTGESRVADGLDAENVGARGISRVQRTALWRLRPRRTCSATTDHSSRRVEAALQKQTEIA